jgi:membrane protein involved in colicin uptake
MLRSLPDERKALAERYTIDAEEADRRRQLGAEQAARQAEASDAARVEAEEAARQAAAEAARKAAAEEAARSAAESSLRAAADSARRAAEQEAARRAAEDAAARAPVARAERRTAPQPIEPASPPQPRLMLTPIDEPPAPIEIAENDEREQTVDLPIYRWFGNG